MTDSRTNILTIDLEEWFHLLDVPALIDPDLWNNFESRIEPITYKLLDLLDSFDAKATFFCLGWVVDKYPNLVLEVFRRGHEIASHSHLHGLVYSQSREIFREDVKRSINSIEYLIGTKVRGYRAPGFSIRESELWAFEVLIELGIEYDSSIFPAYRSHGGFESFPIHDPVMLNFKNGNLLEFPISTTTFFSKSFVVSGGGYFRLAPFSIVNCAAKRNNYNMYYFHPRDFDVGQPKIDNLSLIKFFKSYVGISGAFKKLEKLLSLHDFQTVNKYMQNLPVNVDCVNFDVL